MKKLLKIIEIATLPKTVLLQTNQRYRSQILIAQIEDWKRNCLNISLPYLSYFPRNKHYGRAGPRQSWSGRFIVLIDSANPKMVITIYFNFFPNFFKGFKLFECRRSDPYMTVNKNFVRIDH